jgi:integrase/recombinase XerC
VLYNTDARLSEVANLDLEDVDLSLDTARFHRKGAKDRRVRIGPKTARGLSRYLRARGGHKGFGLPQLWLAVRGAQPLAANGIKLMLKRRGLRAGVNGVHAHRWRHT